MPHSSTICDCTADYLRVYLPGAEQATPPRGRSEPSESELLGGKLPLYSSEVTLPLEFTVDPDAQKPGLLDRVNYLLVEVNRYRGSRVGTGKVDKFALFRSELHSPCSSPLATDLPGALEVPASRLCIPTECEKVQVISEADRYEARVIAELGIETGSVKEEENRGER
jgi:hypothetical protein